MSKTKIAINENHNKGVYHCATKVKDLIKMLKELNPDENAYLFIEDPRNPYGWIDIEKMEYDQENMKVRISTSCHEF